MSTTDSETPTADEQPKRTTAKRVVSTNRRYFFPSSGISLSAGSLDAAHKAHAKRLKQAKAGKSEPETEGEDE